MSKWCVFHHLPYCFQSYFGFFKLFKNSKSLKQSLAFAKMFSPWGSCPFGLAWLSGTILSMLRHTQPHPSFHTALLPAPHSRLSHLNTQKTVIVLHNSGYII